VSFRASRGSSRQTIDNGVSDAQRRAATDNIFRLDRCDGGHGDRAGSLPGPYSFFFSKPDDARAEDRNRINVTVIRRQKSLRAL
jgi:hypothetical protein